MAKPKPKPAVRRRSKGTNTQEEAPKPPCAFRGCDGAGVHRAVVAGTQVRVCKKHKDYYG